MGDSSFALGRQLGLQARDGMYVVIIRGFLCGKRNNATNHRFEEGRARLQKKKMPQRDAKVVICELKRETSSFFV